MFAASLVASCVAPALVGGVPAHAAALARVGGVDPTTHYPAWYEDSNGTALQLCTDAGAGCAAAPAVFGAPGGESFYFLAETELPTAPRPATATNPNPGPGSVSVVLGLEAGYFGPGEGQEKVFQRIRAFGLGLTPNSKYTVLHPYGQLDITTDVDGNSRRPDGTTDSGCAAVPCDFSAALSATPPTPNISPFLEWDSGAPAGFLGDSTVPHTVLGGPVRNFVQVDGPNLGGPGINTIRTDLFTIMGQRAPGASIPMLAAAADSGVAGDNITSVTTPTFTGTASPGRTVNLYMAPNSTPASSRLVGSAVAAASGTYSVSVSTPIALDGSYAFTASQVSGTGVESPASKPSIVTIDTTAPTLSGLALAAATDSGAQGDSITNVKLPTISGVTDAGAVVSLLVDGAPAGSGTASSTGVFSITTTGAGLPDGVRSFTAQATDAAGNVGTSAALNVTIDTIAPAAPSFSPAPGLSTSPQTVTLAAAEANATMYFSTDGSAPTTASTHYIGPITVDFSRTIKAVAVDAAGNVSGSVSGDYLVTTPVGTRIAATLSGTRATGKSQLENRGGGQFLFLLEVINGPASATLDVVIDGRKVTTIKTDASGRGKIQLTNAAAPPARKGSPIQVRAPGGVVIASGQFV